VTIAVLFYTPDSFEDEAIKVRCNKFN